MNNNLTINRDNALAAYKIADKSQQTLLEALFGADTFKQITERPKDVRERVKTFEDACNELGEQHQFVLLYNVFINEFAVTKHAECDNDVLVYLKLRIITAALNEGWEPQFTEDEYRYYPWFELFTQSELDDMSDDEKGRVVGRASYSSYANGGLAFAVAFNASSVSYGNSGSRLAFRTRELAEYAGRQFVELYADFVFPEKA